MFTLQTPLRAKEWHSVTFSHKRERWTKPNTSQPRLQKCSTKKILYIITFFLCFLSVLTDCSKKSTLHTDSHISPVCHHSQNCLLISWNCLPACKCVQWHQSISYSCHTAVFLTGNSLILPAMILVISMLFVVHEVNIIHPVSFPKGNVITKLF